MSGVLDGQTHWSGRDGQGKVLQMGEWPEQKPGGWTAQARRGVTAGSAGRVQWETRLQRYESPGLWRLQMLCPEGGWTFSVRRLPRQKSESRKRFPNYFPWDTRSKEEGARKAGPFLYYGNNGGPLPVQCILFPLKTMLHELSCLILAL